MTNNLKELLVHVNSNNNTLLDVYLGNVKMDDFRAAVLELIEETKEPAQFKNVKSRN